MNAPLVLLYNLDNRNGSRLRLICLKLHIRVRTVAPAELAEPVGALAEGEPFADEMMVMVHFGGKLLNQFLQEIRAAHLPGVGLKAVLTPTNMEWSSVRLHDELRREHEAMRYGQAAHSKE